MAVGESSIPRSAARGTADVRALFNPAFLAALIGRAAEGHRTHGGAPLPMGFAFLVAPVVLHSATRESLPRVNARLATWADGRQLLRAELRWRAPHLTEVTRSGLRFGLRHGLIEFSASGVGATAATLRLPPPTIPDALDCWKAAERLGRWLPRAGPPSTVLALLGLRP